MKNIKLFEQALLQTWLLSEKNEEVNKLMLQWIDFYEKETGHEINKIPFQNNRTPNNFIGMLNQIQDNRLLGEEVKKIKKLIC